MNLIKKILPYALMLVLASNSVCADTAYGVRSTIAGPFGIFDTSNFNSWRLTSTKTFPSIGAQIGLSAITVSPFTGDIYVIAFNASNPDLIRSLWVINPSSFDATLVSSANFPYAAQLTFSCVLGSDTIVVQSQEEAWTVSVSSGSVSNDVQVTFFATCTSHTFYALCYDASSSTLLRSIDESCSGSYTVGHYNITSSNFFSGWATSTTTVVNSSIGWSDCLFVDSLDTVLVKSGQYLYYTSSTSVVADLGSSDWTGVAMPSGMCGSSTDYVGSGANNQANSNKKSSNHLAIIIPVCIVGGLALISLKVVLIALLYKRYKNSATSYKEQSSVGSPGSLGSSHDSLASLESMKSGASNPLSNDSFPAAGLSVRTQNQGSSFLIASPRSERSDALVPSLSEGSEELAGVTSRVDKNNNFVLASPRSERSEPLASPNSAYGSERGLLSGISSQTESPLASPYLTPSSVRSTDPWVVPYYELFFGSEIGRGAYGVVYQGRWKSEQVAIKQVKTEGMTATDTRAFINDIKVMVNLPAHPNVVKLLGVCREPLSMVTEYLENGSVHDYLQSRGNVPEIILYNITLGTARGMLHLHNQGICHRDLNSKNILLTTFLQAKISDFGLSKSSNGEVLLPKDRQGVLRWLAPEILKDQEYSLASDVYSFAITICEAYSRKIPYWYINDDEEVAARVASGELKCEIPANAPESIRNLLRACLNYSPSSRPSFSEIVSSIEKSKL